MRVYLDNCCYNRPFDDQSNLRTALETFAKLQIQSLMRTGKVEYVWSDMDYTEWRKDQYEDLPLEELAKATRESGKTVRAVFEVDAALAHLSKPGVRDGGLAIAPTP